MRHGKTTAITIAAFLVGVIAGSILFRSSRDLQAGAASKPEIIFYSEPGFQGHALHISEDAVDLPFEEFADGTKLLWNDNVGSIVVVSGTWRIFQHGRMNTLLDDTPRELLNLAAMPPVKGWSSVLSATSRGPLRLASLELGAIGADISSVQLVSSQNLPDWLYR
jgi:hypothetical protein